MGTRTSVISICKEPALTKARLPEAAARILHARPLAPRPRSPRSLTCPSSAAHAAPSPPRPAGAPRTESAATPCSRPAGTATAEPWPQRGNPSLSRPRGGGPRERALRLPRPGAQAAGAAAGTMTAGALELGRGGGGSGIAAPSALGYPLGCGHPKLWTPGRKGQAPRGEEELGRRRPGRGSSSAARAAGAAEGGAPGAALTLAGVRLPRAPPPLRLGWPEHRGARSRFVWDAGAVAWEI
ncbi:uncharacterized protein LOC110259558 [Sus scrofa]|uniref:uncharacterized protein LOC110259558 n=1 Tax=Sus scrofa TaxID=9823 RepID=UPI000A2B7DDA|nr:uncharacterized protein LOC110259558 [Sus scrofa]